MFKYPRTVSSLTRKIMNDHNHTTDDRSRDERTTNEEESSRFNMDVSIEINIPPMATMKMDTDVQEVVNMRIVKNPKENEKKLRQNADGVRLDIWKDVGGFEPFDFEADPSEEPEEDQEASETEVDE